MSDTTIPELPPISPFAGLWVRYGIPVMLALLIHAIAGLVLVQGWSADAEPDAFQASDVLNARLLTMEPSAPEPREEAPSDKPQETTEAPPPQASEPIPEEPEPARPESREPPKESAPPAESEPEPEPEVEERDSGAWRETVDSTFESALDAEAERLAEQQAESVTASYVAAIIARIERNWSRPPSARNDMQAELRIALVPTGEVVSVEIVDSSGNAAFDRSAEIAVRQAAPFEVPQDPDLFERQFRQLRLLFHPEDLRK